MNRKINLLKRIFQYKCCFKYYDVLERLELTNKAITEWVSVNEITLEKKENG